MKVHLEAIGVYDIVIDGTPTTDEAKNRNAESALYSSFSEAETRRIMHCSTAHETWKCLENAYGLKSSNAKLELMTEIGNIRCKSAKEVPLIANKILGLKGKLKALGTEVDDALVISSIIRSLPAV